MAKLDDAWKAAKAKGEAAARKFLREHEDFAKNNPGKVANYFPNGMPGSNNAGNGNAENSTEKATEDLRFYDQYRAAVEAGEGSEFLAKHPNFAANLRESTSEDGFSGTVDPRVQDLIQEGTDFGRGLADEFFNPNDVNLLDTAPTAESDEAMRRIKELADAAGVRSDEMIRLLQDQRDSAANARNLTPEEQAAFDAANELLSKAGVRSGETTDLLATLKQRMDTAGDLTDLELEALGISRDALQGLSGAEMQALREQGQAEINRAIQTQANELATAQARGNVRGAAASAQRGQLGQSGVREGRVLERDLAIKNIDEKRLAREAFSRLATDTQGAADTRSHQASDLYSGTLGDVNSEEARQREAANANLGNLTTGTEANRRLRTGAADTLLADTLAGAEKDEFNQRVLGSSLFENAANYRDQVKTGKETFNIGQLDNNTAGRLAAILGGVGVIGGAESGFRAEDFAKTLLDSSVSQAEKDRLLTERLANLSQENFNKVLAQLGLG